MATKPICAVEGCEKASVCRGLCKRHHHKLLRYGDPLGGRATAHGDAIQWIADHVSYAGEECLAWPFGRNGNGYGAVWIGGKQTPASHAMCIAAHGPPPPDKPFSLHSCDRGHEGCVSPIHVRWGSQANNMADSVERGTRSRGEDRHTAKLTEVAVREIRRSDCSTGDLAAAFGVSRSTINNIRARRVWAWLK